MEVFEAIKTRRSIRRYKPDAILDEKLNAVLEAARWAPSWAHTWCCRFVVVQGKEMKSKLAARSLGLGTVHVGAFNSPEVAPILSVPQGVAVVEMIPLGYPVKEARTPPRKELSELLFCESYGQKMKT